MKRRVLIGLVLVALTVAAMANFATVVQATPTQDLKKAIAQEPIVPESDERQAILEDAFDFSQEPQLPQIEPPTSDSLLSAISKGVKFLLENQNADGSWGSHDAQRPYQIYAPIPGSHHAFRSAVTALCVSALIESNSSDPEVKTSIDQGERWLMEHIGEVKRATGDAIYNVWSHAYSIQAFVRLHQRAQALPEHQAKLVALIQQQMNMLDHYESVDGGWGYYDFRYQAAQPTSESTSFVNAAVLIALKEAQQIGVEPNAKTVSRAVEATRRQQKPDFTYLYGEYLKNVPMSGINRPAGSLGRSQACNVAMRVWGDDKINDLVLKNWLYRLYVRNGWLSIGRKRPVPHEAWFQVAGYFYYFGHFYAGYAIQELKPVERGPYQDHLAKIIMEYQEPDGSWWDYPLYGYHKPYGTAFAVMTLVRCVRSR